MQLSRTVAVELHKEEQLNALFTLPEKVLQFGTGVLLRALPDYFIDKANKQHIFNGRIVVIKSTNTGGTDAFKRQDGLFTLLERGIEDGRPSEKISINAAISRVLSANDEWGQIEQCAANSEMQVIISNTTEVGITLVEADATNKQPVSFPGKLLCFLQARYDAFGGSTESGMVIIPTELIVDNGTRLKQIVVTLANLKGLSHSFMDWLQNANDFCNSLVDRIVPGKLADADHVMIEKKLGYEDELMIMSECYRLWAIETNNERTKKILSFSTIDAGVVVVPDINKFRELKLRLLNGTHTLSCGLAHLAGFVTVKDAMNDPDFESYVSQLMFQEIAPLVVQNDITLEEAFQFISQVIDRFKNPYIEHKWLSITVQYTSKMVMRVVPLIRKHYARTSEVPELMALGFASFILFMRSTESSDRIQDDKLPLLFDHWQTDGVENVAENILKDINIFDTDLTQFSGFAEAVHSNLLSLIDKGAANTLHSVVSTKSLA